MQLFLGTNVKCNISITIGLVLRVVEGQLPVSVVLLLLVDNQ